MKDHPTVEHHKDENILVTVEQPNDSFWVSLRLCAKIPLPPEEVFEILTDPDNHKIFRSVKAMRNRKVIKDDKHGKQEAEVEQVGRWRFGIFKGSFSVKLKVIQDKKHKTIDFRLMPSKGKAFMNDFSGGWKVRPDNQDNVEEMMTHPGKHFGPLHGLKKALHEIEDKLAGKHADSCICELHQCVAPALIPPPPLDRVLKKVTIAQVRTIMEDLLREADRRNAVKARMKAIAADTKTEAVDKKSLKAHVIEL